MLWLLILQGATVVWTSNESSSPESGNVEENPPNLIFVLVDDVGWADFSYNVENGAIPTPG